MPEQFHSISAGARAVRATRYLFLRTAATIGVEIGTIDGRPAVSARDIDRIRRAIDEQRAARAHTSPAA